MRSKITHSYQPLNIFASYSRSPGKWRGAPMVTIQFRNLDTLEELETYIIVKGTYEDGIRDCNGFRNWRQWETLIRQFDDYRDHIIRFQPDSIEAHEFVKRKNKNNGNYVINADTKPIPTGELAADYQPTVKPVKHHIVQEQLNTTIGTLFDFDDVVEIEPGRYVLERKL